MTQTPGPDSAAKVALNEVAVPGATTPGGPAANGIPAAKTALDDNAASDLTASTGPTGDNRHKPGFSWTLAIGALVALIAIAVAAITILRGTTPVRTRQVSLDPLTKIGLASATPNATDPSGAPMPTGDLPGWKQVFADDFTTSVPTGGFSGCKAAPTLMASTCSGLSPSVASQLWAYPDGWPDHHSGVYEPSKVLSIHDGMLDYYLHSSGGTHMVAAVLPKITGGINGGGLQYGAYAIRFKADPLNGYKTAFLLWPDSEIWPEDGEIDFPEGGLNGTIGASMHYMGGTSLGQQDIYPTGDTYTGWNTAVIEWTPQVCRFILNGQIIGTSYSLIPSTPMHWVLQAETVNGTPPADNVSGHIYIAWIVAYTPVSGPSGSFSRRRR